MRAKRTLVTGGTGFIGSHLVEALLSQGRRVRVLALPEPFEPIEAENLKMIKAKGAEVVYGDLRNIKSLHSVADGIDSIFHLGAISRPMKIPDRQYDAVNVLGTKNILEVSKKNKLKKFIHVSSVSVLGVSPDGHPLKEDEFQKEDMKYAVSKREGEKLALKYQKKYRLPIVVVRPCLTYGPRCLPRLIMFKFVKLGLFPLFNGGEAKMEFCYVDNAVEALLLAEKDKKTTGEIFNITDGQSYPIKTVLSTIAGELGVKPPFISLPFFVGKLAGHAAEIASAFVGVYPPFSSTAADWMSRSINVYDCSKAKESLGYEPKVSLKKGIKKTIAWYKNKSLL